MTDANVSSSTQSEVHAESQADGRFQSFEEFWPFYLGEHRTPLSRGLHYAGTTMALGALAAAAVTLNPKYLLVAPIVGYAPAWVGHFLVEKNRPATFTYPVWSLMGDVKMLGLAVRGKIGAEMTRYYGSANPSKDAPRVDLAPSPESASASASTSTSKSNGTNGVHAHA